ncbi:MAG TPA: cation transporter [Caldithrix abyssi]|uniref:Cation transporter n=1 Tax=Caldithrix abyssi TaxID=187145 RepID=A0A7V5PMB3_CALAY|nr:cation transporter [Caldithrix abyssi]
MNQRKNVAVRVTLVSILWNLVLSGIKFAAGIYGRSAALVADGVHSLSDLLSDLVVLAGVHYGSRPRDQSHHYGHGKFETLAAIIIGLILLIAALEIAWHGGLNIYRHLHGKPLPGPYYITLIVALSSIGIKELLYQYTIKAGNKTGSAALKANAWHHRTDALSSVAAALGISGAIFLGEEWVLLDPLAAVFVGLWVLKFTLSLLVTSVNELLEASLGKEMDEKILQVVQNIPGVQLPHNLKTRKVGHTYAVEMHIKVNRNLNIVEAHDISTRVEEALKSFLGKESFISIHVEPLEDAQER